MISIKKGVFLECESFSTSSLASISVAFIRVVLSLSRPVAPIEGGRISKGWTVFQLTNDRYGQGWGENKVGAYICISGGNVANHENIRII